MVGVPGRSKGCVTCRKRKKGCDLKRPACGQCEARGLVCGGYDNDRIFINHATRPEKSKILIATSAADTIPVVPVSSPTPPGTPPTFNFQRYDPSNIDILLPDGLTRSAYREKSVEAFFTMYAPNCGSDIDSPQMVRTNGFASVLSFLYAREEALKLALVAIGTAMLGRRTRDEALIRQGRSLYGKALQEMGKALKEERRAKSEALLAVPRIGAMFEMLFGADATPGVQAKSWRSHAHGELAMIKARGPRAHTDGIAHQIFVDGRVIPMIAAIRMRKATILNDTEWKSIPWENHPKTPKDLLLDILVGVPEILEDIDKLAANDHSTNEKLRMSTVRKCRQLDAYLKAWASTHDRLIYHPFDEDPVAFAFQDLSSAYLSIFYWTTTLILYEALQMTLNQPSHSLDPLMNPRTYARRIALSVPYFFQEQHGIWGAITVAFPMGCALLYLRRSGTEADNAYMGVVMKAWVDPKLPSAIRDFLTSMRKEAAGSWRAGGWSKERVGHVFGNP